MEPDVSSTLRDWVAHVAVAALLCLGGLVFAARRWKRYREPGEDPPLALGVAAYAVASLVAAWVTLLFPVNGNVLFHFFFFFFFNILTFMSPGAVVWRVV
jgi:hypothetical protein